MRAPRLRTFAGIVDPLDGTTNFRTDIRASGLDRTRSGYASRRRGLSIRFTGTFQPLRARRHHFNGKKIHVLEMPTLSTKPALHRLSHAQPKGPAQSQY